MNKSNTISYDYKTFQNSIITSYLDWAKTCIQSGDYTEESLKNFTLNMIEDVKFSKNSDLMYTIAKKVKIWKTDAVEKIKANLITYSKTQPTIVESFIKKVMGTVEILIVVDDSADMKILEINEHCFGLCEENECISDFAVLDLEEIRSLELTEMNYKKIYQRG